jgi:hypothetical protein
MVLVSTTLDKIIGEVDYYAAIKKIYKEDIELYNIDFKQSETMKSFIYSTSSEYLQKIKKHLKKDN